MAFLPSVFTFPSFVTGASTTSALEIPGNFLYTYLEVPTMSAGYSAGSTPLWIQGSSDGITFRRFSNPETNTNTAGANDFLILSSVSGRFVQIPNLSLRYLKIEISGTVTTPASAPPFKLVCVSNQ